MALAAGLAGLAPAHADDGPPFGPVAYRAPGTLAPGEQGPRLDDPDAGADYAAPVDDAAAAYGPEALAPGQPEGIGFGADLEPPLSGGTPEAALPAGFTGPPLASPEGSVAAEASAIPAVTWTLDQLVDRALRSNPRVLAQRSGQDVARAAEQAARWEYFPNPQVQVEGTPHDHQINATVTQPLYAFGRLGASLAAARAQGRVAGQRTAEARRDVSLRVLDLYAQFATLTRDLAVFDADIARHLALEGMIHRRVEAGVSAPVDLNLVQTRLNQSRITRTTLNSRLRSVLAALSQVVGVDLDAGRIGIPGRAPGGLPAPGRDENQHFLVDEAGAEGLVQRCLDRNPSLARADAEIAATQAEAKRARAVVFPVISAKFENRVRTSLYPASGLPDTRLTIGFTVAAGSGLASLANIRAAEGRSRAAMQFRDALRRDVTAGVIGAVENFTAARKTVEALRQNQIVQEQTAQSYNRMFLAGKRSWLDVLNMVREQTGIERDLADSEVQLMVADYRLRIEAGEIA